MLKSALDFLRHAVAAHKLALISLSIFGVIAAAYAAVADVRDSAIVSLREPDLYLLNRITWGANPTSAREFVVMGSQKFLDRQLHPSTDDPLPKEVRAQIDELSISHTPVEKFVADMDQELRTANSITDPKQKQDAQKAYQDSLNRYGREPAVRSILRDLYSPDQLLEQMTWFWFNHFNVHLYKSNIRLLIGNYEEKAIRTHALGRFRDLLTATLRDPAMLRYLDNDQNAAGRINENYAREIMELHTIGVGSGYTQGDVQELARILTGVGVNFQPQDPNAPKPVVAQPDHIRNGLFEFNPARHDYGVKHLLGHTIEGRGFAEVEQALDIISRHPATAAHVSRQLATYFVSDTPPEPLVQRMAQSFRTADGDIVSVLLVMFKSPEFANAQKFKDPMQFVLSAVRLAYDTKVIQNPAPILGWLNRMAQGLYNHPTPDGYPMTAAAWNGPGQMAVRFEIARQIGANAGGMFKAPMPDAVERPAFPQIASALYYNVLQYSLSPATRAALDQATSPQEWNALYLSSPEFMR